jgi:hypothetical protein
MKKILLFLSCASLYANNTEKVEDFYGYSTFNLGPAPIPLPGFGIGLRSQNHKLGYDAHLQLTTVGYLSQLKWQNSALFYITPNLKSQFYTGVGGSLSAFFSSKKVSEGYLGLSPEFTFGKSYLNEADKRRFMELQVSWPTTIFGKKQHDTEVLYFPGVVFTYGIGF